MLETFFGQYLKILLFRTICFFRSTKISQIEIDILGSANYSQCDFQNLVILLWVTMNSDDFPQFFWFLVISCIFHGFWDISDFLWVPIISVSSHDYDDSPPPIIAISVIPYDFLRFLPIPGIACDFHDIHYFLDFSWFL